MSHTKKKFSLSALMISAGAFAAVYLPGVAFAATADTDELFATVKKTFKDGSGLFLTLMGVVIFIAAAFWIFSSIAQWTKGKLDMGEMLIHVFIAIIGIMIVLWLNILKRQKPPHYPVHHLSLLREEYGFGTAGFVHEGAVYEAFRQ